jgi:2-oxoglutarate ferredoxin oxidoreductase subunit beta
MLDVVSPCVTFNDHEGSTKSYKYMKDHEEPLQDINFVPHFEEIDVDYDPGTTLEVTMHDGSRLRLHKLEADYDPTNRVESIRRLYEAHEKGEVLTGVFYINPTKPSFVELLNMTEQPLASLPESIVRPGRAALEQCMEELR